MISPNLLRRLDRWIGIPLCWGITLLRRSRVRLFTLLAVRTPEAQQPRRILLVLLSEAGSMVLADPAVRSLIGSSEREAFFVTFEHNRAALGITGTVPEDRIFSFRTDSLFTLLLDLWHWRRWVFERKIDTLVDLELFACLSAVLCASSGVQRRVGFHALVGGVGRYRGDLYTHQVAYDPMRHIAFNYLALIDALLDRKPTEHANLPLPGHRALRAVEIDAVQSLLSTIRPLQNSKEMRLVLVNPNASELLPQRRWPVPHFVALICRLLERHADVVILLVGGPADMKITAAIASAVSDPRCADIAGRLTLPELPALFASAAVLVSNDSGPAHFAAVSDLPVVVLFGPETPTLYRPLGRATVLTAGLACSPCVNVSNQRQTRCQDNRCMREISVDAVLGATEAHLAGPAQLSNVVSMPLRSPPASAGKKQEYA